MQNEKTDSSYFQSYLKSHNNIWFTPQLLNSGLKNLNMHSTIYDINKIRHMILQPHLCEQELRKLSYRFHNEIMSYKNVIDLWSSMLTFDSEPIPCNPDGSELTHQDFNSNAYKRDYKVISRFFQSFNVKDEFLKVLWNMCMYDTYYTSIRNDEDHIWLQELPSSHCIIDAESYLGYLFSFDLSYFTNVGVDISGYSPELIRRYKNAIQGKENNKPQNYPNRNGSWVNWTPMYPDDAWVFKFNPQYAGSVPPLLGMLIDYAKLDKFKNLEELKKELEVYKVIVATVPRVNNNKGGSRVDNFAISAKELGEFVASVKNTLHDKVDFKAAPLENFKMFDFSPTATERDILETTLKNIQNQSMLTNAVSLTDNVNVASANIYKTFHGAKMSKLYFQFENFCNYQINKRTKRYKFKVKFVGTIWDKEERIKRSNEDMRNGLILPEIFSSRGMNITEANNSINMMYSMGIPDMFKPIQMSSTMSSSDIQAGRPNKSDDELTDSGANTKTNGSNETTKE
ncbi:MAG: hypothetical protein K2F81_05535 [Ruminococcus sp.]|nr:hypothetical protein [Ruminococcus sp.]